MKPSFDPCPDVGVFSVTLHKITLSGDKSGFASSQFSVPLNLGSDVSREFFHHEKESPCAEIRPVELLSLICDRALDKLQQLKQSETDKKSISQIVFGHHDVYEVAYLFEILLCHS